MTEGGVVCAAGIDPGRCCNFEVRSGTQIALATGNLGKGCSGRIRFT